MDAILISRATLITLAGCIFFSVVASGAETSQAKKGPGCLVQTTFKLPDKTTYAAEHCISGQERCNSAPNGYCFDFGVVDPTIVSKTCTPVPQCPGRTQDK